MTAWLLTELGAILYASFVEYFVHRWTQHSTLFGKHAKWQQHMLSHHAGNNDLETDIPVHLHMVLLCASPLALAVFWLGWPWLIILACQCWLYTFVWNELHAAIHDVGGIWVTKLPWFDLWKRHHDYHHDHETYNFGTNLIFSDRLFGTKR